MNKCRVLGLDDSEEWNRYLKQLPIVQQDIYFTPEYYSLNEANGDGKALCFAFEHGNDLALYPFLINRINDLGYDLDEEYFDIQGAYGYNGVISSSYEKGFIDSFYEAFSEYAVQRNIVCEFVRFHPILNNARFSQGYVDVLFDRNTVALDLTNDRTHIWTKDYSSNNRNILRKALDSGVQCFVLRDYGSLRTFVQIYNDTMKRLSAASEYYFSDAYFNTILSVLGDEAFVVLCKTELGFEAASLFLLHGKFAHYHLSGRSDSSNKNYLTNIMIDSAIRFAQESGCSTMHLGGGRSKSDDDSLLKFKKNFSKTTYEFFIGKRVYYKPVYELILNQWREMNPLSASKYKQLFQGYRQLD